jgi:predicted MFS family arabinose efflux permease
MLGLPIGLGLSFIVSGNVADLWGWRAAFMVAAIPGLILGLLCLWVPEPPRGRAEEHLVGADCRQGSPYWLVLRIPTMWWIILSGALHNFNMYAIGSFLNPFLQRYHGLSTSEASWISGAVYGCFGGLGVFLGGWTCDWIVKRRIRGRLEITTLALAVATPCIYLALQQPAGAFFRFGAWMLPGCMLLYVYYSGVYAAIQDIVEPALRGTAMSLYFFAMYLLGGAAGPVILGWISDRMARRAAALEGYDQPNELHKAVGLHDAMYIIPLLSAILVPVLFAASRTVKGDYDRLQKWMSTSRGEGTASP